MADSTTVLYNPSNPSEDAKRFTFDFSYWSHDGFKETTHPGNAQHSQQQQQQQSTTGGTSGAASSTVHVADLAHPNGYQYADQVKMQKRTGHKVTRTLSQNQC